jgi:hypothetical protein
MSSVECYRSKGRNSYYYEGKKVQFALTSEGVADSVAHLENPGPDISSRYD